MYSDATLVQPSSCRNGVAAGKSRSWRYSLLVALLCVVAVRLLLTVYLAGWALLSPHPWLHEHYYSRTGVEVLTSGWEGMLLGVWQREDALWYQKIATVGYSTADLTQEFFPLYPLLMRGVMLATGVHPVVAGIFVSELALAIGLFLLHRLVGHAFGFAVATRTLVYVSLFPSAFFLHAPFTESLMLALVVMAFYLVGLGRWREAAIAGYFVGLTKAQGVLLGPPLALLVVAGERKLWEWRRVRWTRRDLAKAGVLVMAPLLGSATYLMAVDSAWRRPQDYSGIGPGHGIPSVPGISLVRAVEQFLAGNAGGIQTFDLALGLTFLVLVVIAVFRLPAPYALYSALFYLAPVSREMVVRFPLMSFNRYALLLFPCLVVLAMASRRPWMSVSVAALGLLLMLFWSAVFYAGGFVA